MAVIYRPANIAGVLPDLGGGTICCIVVGLLYIAGFLATLIIYWRNHMEATKRRDELREQEQRDRLRDAERGVTIIPQPPSPTSPSSGDGMINSRGIVDGRPLVFSESTSNSNSNQNYQKRHSLYNDEPGNAMMSRVEVDAMLHPSSHHDRSLTPTTAQFQSFHQFRLPASPHGNNNSNNTQRAPVKSFFQDPSLNGGASSGATDRGGGQELQHASTTGNFFASSSSYNQYPFSSNGPDRRAFPRLDSDEDLLALPNNHNRHQQQHPQQAASTSNRPTTVYGNSSPQSIGSLRTAQTMGYFSEI